MSSYVSRIVSMCKESLVGKKAKNTAVGESLLCIGNIVKILREGFSVYVDDLLGM